MFHLPIQFSSTLAQPTPAKDVSPATDPGQVTTAWMAGVVGIMLLFGVIALVGYLRKPGESPSSS